MSMLQLSEQEAKLAERFKPETAKALALSSTSGAVTFTNAGEVMDFAKMMALANSGVREHLRGNAGACLAIVVQAGEWGMSPFAVANKSYFVNNQIAFESQLIQAVILRRAPIRGRIRFDYDGEGPTRRCRAWCRDRDDPEEVFEITTPMVKDIKVKNSPLWTADPDQQLSYYAGRALCRRHFPDVLLGVYDVEELQGMRRADGSFDAVPQEQAPKGIKARLDALADEPETQKAQGPIIDHDPVTGEIPAAEPVAVGEQRMGVASRSSRRQAERMAEPPADDALDTRTPREILLDELRAGVAAGERVTKLLNALGGERRPLVTDADLKALREAEKAIAAGAPVSQEQVDG